MFISKFPPYKFANGDILSPESVNANNNYFKKSLDFIADKQTCRWTSTYSLCPTVGSSLTSATANIASYLRRKMPPSTIHSFYKSPPVTVESFSIVIYYQATTTFTMNIVGGTETITFPVRDASLALEPYYVVQLMNITTNSSDLFSITLPAGVTITKFDVTVGFASDRYLSGNLTNATTISKPSLSLTTYNDASLANATTFSSLKTSLETAATSATSGTPFRWIAVDFYDLDLADSGTQLAYRVVDQSWASPSFANVAGSAAVIALWADIDQGTVGTGSNVITLTNTINTTAVINALTLAVGASVQGGIYATTPVRNSSTDAITSDWALRFTVSNTNVISRATVYILLQ